MAEHAKAQGFGGIVLMIDEFLLWLAEKSGQEFVQEINNLNVIVDHNTGQRPRRSSSSSRASGTSRSSSRISSTRARSTSTSTTTPSASR